MRLERCRPASILCWPQPNGTRLVLQSRRACAQSGSVGDLQRTPPHRDGTSEMAELRARQRKANRKGCAHSASIRCSCACATTTACNAVRCLPARGEIRFGGNRSDPYRHCNQHPAVAFAALKISSEEIIRLFVGVASMGAHTLRKISTKPATSLIELIWRTVTHVVPALPNKDTKIQMKLIQAALYCPPA
ncbi:hypothetical protein V5799_033424 [Amblyomma americanum]|uniref:Uncharacterized protein n=1 Tax=Amblyomma americanum TaxID=6943 RepID=A0AAQ4DNC7_AMBAM